MNDRATRRPGVRAPSRRVEWPVRPTVRGPASRQRPSTTRSQPQNRTRGRTRSRAGRRWLNLGPLVVSSLAALIALTLGWLVLFSSVLAARQVKVTGLVRVAEERVVEIARPEIGRPLARIDLAKIRDRVAAIREVESAAVSRGWPNTLRIEVRERAPVAVVTDGDQTMLVDRAGVTFSPAGQTPRDMPVVRLDARPGSARDRTAILGSAVAVVTALPDDLAARVSEVVAATPDSVTLRLRDGATVLWGNAERSGRKAEVLAVLLEQKASAYDVSAPDFPTVRP